MKQIIGLMVFALPLFAVGQIINIDKTDTLPYIKKAKWDASASAGLEIDKQQTTLYDASNFVDVALQKYDELFIFSGSNRFTYNGPQDFLNTGYLHFRWRHDYKAQLHPEFFTQYQWDTKIGMKHRFVTGANYRYNFWHRKMWEMTFASGVFFENETWDFNSVDTSKIPAIHNNIATNYVKSNGYIKWEGKVSDNANVAIAVFYQARFNNFLHPRISGNISFDVNISKHFELGLKYTGLYDAAPIGPITSFYYSLSNNLTYKL